MTIEVVVQVVVDIQSTERMDMKILIKEFIYKYNSCIRALRNYNTQCTLEF